MGDVISGKFPVNKDRPDWVVKAMKRHSGLSYRRDAGGYPRLEGTSPKLPSGIKVGPELGYMRSTGQWREDAESGIQVEVFCCMSAKTGWLPVGLVTGVRMVDDLRE